MSDCPSCGEPMTFDETARGHACRPPVSAPVGAEAGEKEKQPMLGVYIQVNGVVIYARTAVRRDGRLHVYPAYLGKDEIAYECDDGSFVAHDPEDGAVALAKKLLDTIKEQK